MLFLGRMLQRNAAARVCGDPLVGLNTDVCKESVQVNVIFKICIFFPINISYYSAKIKIM